MDYWYRSDWFKNLTGFTEESYDVVQRKLEVVDGPLGQQLRSKVNGRAYYCGALELVSLNELRERCVSSGGLPGKLRVSVVEGEVKKMHSRRENEGALFQVASQFNLLEMVSYSVTPEDGVTRYAGDPTQGPACAVAAGAGTIYRNYFAPCNGRVGQRENSQLDGIRELGLALAESMGGRNLRDLWIMRNGYCMCSREGLADISAHLLTLEEPALDALRAKLRIGVHSNVEVTYHLRDDEHDGHKPLFVSQAYCSALPVSYCGHSRDQWGPFATLVLEACYEATLLAGILNAKSRGSNVVFLTQVGGGAFGNSRFWIERAMRRAFAKVADQDLDVRIVCYGRADGWITDMIEELNPRKRQATGEGQGEEGEQRDASASGDKKEAEAEGASKLSGSSSSKLIIKDSSDDEDSSSEQKK